MANYKEAQATLDQKRGELKQFLDERTTPDGLDFKGDDLKAFNDRNDELKGLHDSAMQLKAAEDAAREQMDALSLSNTPVNTPSMPNPAFRGAVDERQAARMQPQGAQAKSLGAQFTESAEYKAKARETNANFGVDIPGLSLRTVVSTGAGFAPFNARIDDVVPYANRRLTVADLMPQTDTTASAIIYMEQTTQTNNADTVAESGTKPESALAWTQRTVPVEVIAHTLPITNQQLEDVPGIRAIIDEELVYLLKLSEEYQLLNGDGSSPDLQGILTKSGVQTQAKSADNVFTAAMKAFTLIRYTGFAEPSAGVLNPNDWQDIVTTQDTTGRFIYGDPANMVEPRIWGVPIVVTPAMTENTGLFGDFRMYTRLWRKGGIRVEVGLVNDQFLKNQQTIRCEERAALQIRRASAFCKLTGI